MLYSPLVLWLVVASSPVTEPENSSRTRTSHPGFPTAISLAVVSDRLALSDPFDQNGVSSFSSSATGIAFKLDTDQFHLDATGQMLGRSLEHRRIKVTLNGPFLRLGKSWIGLALAYHELGYRRHSSKIGDVDLYTIRQSREYDYGVTIRTVILRGVLRTSATLGYIENQYNSVVVMESFTGSRLMVNDGTPIIAISTSFETEQFWSHFQLSSSVRYVRTFKDQSSWTPRNELSGHVGLDVRVFSGTDTSFSLGIVGRIGPREHILTSDTSLGLRAIWKIK